MPRNYRKKTFRPRRKNNNKKRVAKVSKPLRKAIQKIVKGDLETKMVTKAYGPASFNGQISSKTEWMYPVPEVYQAGGALSVDNNTRIGDSIQPTRLQVHATVSLGNEVLRTVDIIVKFFVFNLKSARSDLAVASASTPDAGQFLDGGSTNVAFLGNTTDLGLPINTKVFTPIHTYSFRLAKGCGYINGGGFSDTYVNGNSTTFKHWSFTIPLPKNFRYGDNAATQPQNFCPVMAVGYAHLDGTSADAISQDIKVTYRSNLWYKDA